MKIYGGAKNMNIPVPSALHRAMKGALGSSGRGGKIRNGALQETLIGLQVLYVLAQNPGWEPPDNLADYAAIVSAAEGALKTLGMTGNPVLASRFGTMRSDLALRQRAAVMS